MTTATLSKFSIGARFVGQPVLSRVDELHNVVMNGLTESKTGAQRWSYTDSMRDSDSLRFILEHGIKHVTLDQPGPPSDPWDMAKLREVAQYLLIEHGITSYWYGQGFDDDIVIGEIRDIDPARYARWRDGRIRPVNKLPAGLNLNLDVYRVLGESAEAWYANRGELLRVIQAFYPDDRILIDVWHRHNDPSNTPGAPLLPVWVFRQMLRFARRFGRVCWWFDEQDSVLPWDPAVNAYQRAFLEEAGLV